MSKELINFFKAIEKQKKSKTSITENESLIDTKNLSVSVKASEITDFFKVMAEEKRIIREQQEKDQTKLAELEKLLFSLKEEKEKEKEQEEGIPNWEPEEEKPLILDKEIEVKEPEVEDKILENIKEAVHTANQLLIEPTLVDLSAQEITAPTIGKDAPEEKEEFKLDQNDIIKELSKIAEKNKVSLAEDKITDLTSLKKEFTRFKELVTQQMSSIGGGGSTKISQMDDVSTAAQQNGYALKYNSATGKYDFGEVASDLSAVDQDIVPDATNTRSLGTDALRWKTLYLHGQTLDLGGAIVDSDGSGQLSISAEGVTLPAGSKAGTKKISVISTGAGTTEQAASQVPFFTAAGGLSSAAATFNFNATVDDRYVFTGDNTFTLSNGQNLSDSGVTLFQF
jgi:hypothetical protein